MFVYYVLVVFLYRYDFDYLQFKSIVNSGEVAGSEELTVALSLLQQTSSLLNYARYIVCVAFARRRFETPRYVLHIVWICLFI